MRTTSNIMPILAFEIENIRKGYCDIVFIENVEEIQKEDETLYEYDLYRMKTPYRQELHAIVENDYDNWINRAKEIEKDIFENPYINDIERMRRIHMSTEQNTEDIKVTQTELQVTQTAVDFLLMSGMNISTMSLKSGGSDMAAYFAMRILKGMLKYEDVIKMYPEYKGEIDLILRSENREDLIAIK